MTARLDKYRVLIIFSLLYIVYFIGHFIEILDIDAAQYASISAEMSRTNSFLEVFHRGQDYLDKPPLLFWISSLSFKIFGVSSFSYHIFPVVFSFLGIWSTYKLAKLFYCVEVSRLAAIIWGSTQALFLMNHDIRTDNLLTTFTILAIWQLIAYLQTNKMHFLVVGFVAVGLAMLAKGPIGLITPAVAIFGHILFMRQWKNLIKPSWFLGLMITGIVLFPMCWGLYHQYDLQPEKVVPYVQEKGVSGLKFYFWTQSFGWITAESKWNNDPGLFFQMSSFLWSFLPWTLFAIVAYFSQAKQLFKSRFKISEEYPQLKEGFTWFAVSLIFMMISLSSFQLPHYTYLVYPLIAIFTSNFILNLDFTRSKNAIFIRLLLIQKLLLILLLIGVLMLLFFVFPIASIFMLIILCAVVIILICRIVIKTTVEQLIINSFVTILLANLFLNSYFYPNLLTYQSGTQAGKIIEELNFPEDRVFCFLTAPYSIDIYSNYSIKEIKEGALIAHFPKGNYCIFTSQQGYDEFINLGYKMILIKKIQEYPITNLTFTFLNYTTREQVISHNYLVEIVIE